MKKQKTDGHIIWAATEIKCDFCGRSTTLGACQLWGDFALCEGCDALVGDKYDFDMQQEERQRENQDLRQGEVPVHPPLAR